MADAYPTIARLASDYGWVEFGIDDLDRPFVRAQDEGGTVWEGEAWYTTLGEALGDLEEGLGWSGNVVVVRPPDLRKMVVEKLRLALALNAL